MILLLEWMFTFKVIQGGEVNADQEAFEPWLRGVSTTGFH
jgi:hypothetical protein